MGKVFVEVNDKAEYPSWEDDFNPSFLYKEYQFGSNNISKKSNDAYDLFRNCLIHMGLDKEHQGTKEWNPFGDFITPGNKVLIKPNWVMHFNGNKNAGKHAMDCLVTHPSLLRAACDYCIIALKGEGEVIIADAPMQDCDLDCLLEKMHYNSLLDFYKKQNLKVSFKDLRMYQSVFNGSKVIVERKYKDGVGLNVDMGELSIHEHRAGAREYQVDNYDKEDTHDYHSEKKHIYSINKDVLEADVVVNFCKPKTHRLAGYTGAMKNIVGISYNKASLPHRVKGSISEGGDSYLNDSRVKRFIDAILDRKIKNESKNRTIRAAVDYYVYGALLLAERRFGKDPYIKGIWSGNDTIWRTTVDLNYILRFADKNGIIKDGTQRKIISFGDMIIGGDHNGPCQPTPKHMGVIIAAYDSRDFDVAFCKLVGGKLDQNPLVKAICHNETDYLFGRFDELFIFMNGDEKGEIKTVMFPEKWTYVLHEMWQ